MKDLSIDSRAFLWAMLFSLLLFTGQVFGNDSVDRESFAALDIVDEQDLKQIRAGDFDITTTVQSIQDLQASVIGGDFNAHSIVNGAINIKENAFENFSGIGLVVGNTGNNNAIGAALGVTFHLQ